MICGSRNCGNLWTGLVGIGMILLSSSIICGSSLLGLLFGIRCDFGLRVGYLWVRVGCWQMVDFGVGFDKKIAVGVVFIFSALGFLGVLASFAFSALVIGLSLSFKMVGASLRVNWLKISASCLSAVWCWLERD